MSSAGRILGTNVAAAAALGVAGDDQLWATVSVPLQNDNPTPEQLAQATLAALGFTEADVRAYRERYGIDLVESFADSFRKNGINRNAIAVNAEYPRGVARVNIPEHKLDFLRDFLASRRASDETTALAQGDSPSDLLSSRDGTDAGGSRRATLEAGLRRQAQGETPASRRIKELLSYGVFDWSVTGTEEQQIIETLRNDPDFAATVADLQREDWLGALFTRVDEAETRRELVRLVGTRSDASTRALVEPHVNGLGREWQVQYNLARLGVPDAATAFDRAPFNHLVSADPTAAFTGVGASGTNPTALDVPVIDQFNLLREDPATVQRYTNPVGSLPGYLATLTPDERARQAELLLRQPISTTMAEAYGGRLPSRADVIRAAARAYNLEPELVAAFLLAEQRDQTRNEDAKDYTAATSLAQANTSIGLGQVVISTARRNDLFSDLIGANSRGQLSHDDYAKLLADDAVNIFAAAKYIRQVADMAASAPPEVQARFRDYFPGVDFNKFKEHSSAWPFANIQALGSEYTSAPWDAAKPGKNPPYVDSPGWGHFVGEAYRDANASGVFK